MNSIATITQQNNLLVTLQSRGIKEPSSKHLLDITAEQLLQYIQLQHQQERREKNLLSQPEELFVNEYNLEPLLQICANFTQDPGALKRFGMQPNKGLLVTGLPGQGKTHFFHLLRYYLNKAGRGKSFAIKPVLELLLEYEKDGPETIKDFSQVRYQGKELVPVLYDDILAERPARYYGGPPVRFMIDVIHQRANLYSYQNILTYFTTNYRYEEILEVYGERSMDRILSMCNIVVFPPEATNWRTFDHPILKLA